MPTLPQLLDAATYRPCDWDLRADRRGRELWVAHFRHHLDTLLPILRRRYRDATDAQVERCRDAYLRLFDEIERTPERFADLSILLMDELRQGVLAAHGFPDPYADVKQRENAAALARLREILDDLDAAPPAEQIDRLAVELMAGNLFDLGALPLAREYGRHGSAAAFARLVPPRPWWCDDVAAFARRVRDRPHRHVAFFVDNAGSDFVLGCLPLMRWLAGHGSRVTVAANSTPALNDITAAEAADVLRTAGASDPALRAALDAGRVRVRSTGSGAPLIDLARLSAEFVEAVADADLIALHGMGRSVESNRLARFACDALRTAVIKDEFVAEHVGAALYDCVFRYTPAG